MESIQPAVAVILVLGLLCGVLWFMRKRGAAAFHLPRISSSGRERKLDVIERVSLGPQHGLHLVRVGNRSIVVATAPSSCRILCDLAAGETEGRKP